MTLSRTLTDRALALSWSDIDATARAAAKTFLHDTLCVGAAGARAPLADNVLAAARRWGEGTACGVLGRPGVRLRPRTCRGPPDGDGRDGDPFRGRPRLRRE
jgi:2-methylcitrate dehydratase PrpD